MKTLKVGMLGCGVVGSQIARLLVENKSDLTSRAGANLELVKVAVKDIKTKREGIANNLLTDDAKSVVNDPEIDLIIEVIGGINPAKELILTAIKNGKSVVTANKALLAQSGAELYAAADNANVDLYYEAAVAGAIPILRPLRESLVGDQVLRIMGIVNGTTNYILTKMDESGTAFEDALKQAQALGFAEADPTADVEAIDAASKAAILAGLAFHSRVSDADVYREGITKITATDVKVAKAMDMVIKLLAIAELTPDGEISVRVHPALISRTHPLASVRESFNAVFVEAKSAGQLMFYGKGAGGEPTASAILGDLVAVARHKVSGGIGPKESDYADLKIAKIGQTKTRYLIRLNVADKPGVLESVAHVFASHGVSIQTVRQTGAGDKAELIVMTHSSTESALSETVKDLSKLAAVTDVASVLRVEGVN
ncbi:MAG: homoserine dehydrogenase [Actinobacteria bacterium]|jgi:homoserine dehydrogenase|uniref:Homoserine dehydrogenase n=1 Tax=freshwater metagenome TaxID=449393 RepID=A0A6J6NW40_9ZZZZ|nr:homoserine dehydrogenase [Actinomycetota bacterium]MTA47014.1 homoserine dehydrogenase [Actinomycetota bacterium]